MRQGGYLPTCAVLLFRAIVLYFENLRLAPTLLVFQGAIFLKTPIADFLIFNFI
jgi:hypothetical protein